MKTIWALGVSAALALASSGAGAFQEQKVDKPDPGAAQAPVAQEPADPSLGVTDPSVAKPANGTEVRIPGLGKLGVLPKMDFGLELLYGAADPKQEGPPDQNEHQFEDLTVHGTLKHNF